MPGHGPAPKLQHQRERDTKRRQADSVTVRRDGVLRGPDLDLSIFSPQTVDWFDTWRAAPQAALFEETDWQRLIMLLPLVDLYWKRPTALILGEIRLNEERLGATVTDRLRAKIRIEQADDENSIDATVTQLHVVSQSDVMARLNGEK